MCEFCGNVTPTVVAADVQENGRGVSHFVHSACIVSCPQVEAHLLAAAALLFDLIVILYFKWIVWIWDYLLWACPPKTLAGLWAGLPRSLVSSSLQWRNTLHSWAPHLSPVILWICIGGISCQTPSGSELPDTLRRCQEVTWHPEEGHSQSQQLSGFWDHVIMSLFDMSSCYPPITKLWNLNFTCQTQFTCQELLKVWWRCEH